MIMVQFLQLAAYSGQLRYDAQPIQRPHSPELTRGDLVQVVAHSGQLPQSAGSTVGAGVRRWGCATPDIAPHPLRQLGLGQSSRRRSSSASETRI